MKNREKGNGNQAAQIILILLVICTMVFVLATLSIEAGENTKDRVTSLTDGWYFLEEGAAVPLSLPASVDSNTVVTIYYDGLTAEDAGKTITTRGAQYGLTISLNGEILYQYTEEYFERNTQMKSKQDCDAVIPTDFTGGTLELSYTSAVRGKIQMSQVFLGSGSAIAFYHISNISVVLGMAFLFVILGIVAVGVYIYLYTIHLPEPRFKDAAFFLFFCSIWLVTDTSIVQQQTGTPAVVCMVSFYMFMLLAVPMLYFVKNTADLKKYRILDWLICAFYVNAVGQGLLNYFFGIPFVDMLWVTHFLLASGVTAALLILIREYRKTRIREIRWILTALAVLGMSGVLALILYWLLEIPYYGSIFEFGILIFVILILGNIVITMAENIHYRLEMQIYQRMSREDWMTGLENRQPFEEALVKIQREAGNGENAALIFLKVSQIKTINEESGHAAGDELILGAAKCISAVFSGEGHCYRTNGDEFGVLFSDTAETEAVWKNRLDEEIRRYNRSGRYKLAIDWGWSSLRKEDGTRKTISDWKYDADIRMIENRGGKKYDRL